MFTGLIEAVGKVAALRRHGDSAELVVELGELARRIRPGDSVAVSGACLTATAIGGSRVSFDCVAETLSRTKLGSLAAGSQVNIERALAVGSPVGGHFVTGHVDSLGAVASMRAPSGAGLGGLLEIEAPPSVMEMMVEKGSVAVDGVSLTVASASEARFAVALVPYTLEHTTLGRLSAGEAVNIETDLLGKYVRRFLGGARGASGDSSAGGLTEGFLAEHGFA